MEIFRKGDDIYCQYRCAQSGADSPVDEKGCLVRLVMGDIGGRPVFSPTLGFGIAVRGCVSRDWIVEPQRLEVHGHVFVSVSTSATLLAALLLGKGRVIPKE